MRQRTRLVAAVGLVVFGVLGRMALQGLPNVEPLTAAALLAGSFLGGAYGIAVPIATVAVSDILIGNNAILVFTWSAWAIVGILGWLLRRRAHPTARFSLELTGMGLLANIAFFLWTNFGVWALFDYYPPGLDGLLASYIAGLPFLKYQMTGTLIIVPIVSGATFVFVRAGRPAFTWAASRLPLSKILNRG